MSDKTFHHRKTNILIVIVLLVVVLVLLILGVVAGPGFDAASNDPLWAALTGLFLAGIIAALVWVLWSKPRALVIGDDGLHIPLAFSRPLHWDEIHRVRRVRSRGGLYGKRDWLIIDPSPGVLAPIRLPTWRRLDLWFQKHHGVRIPLHGLAADPADVVAAIEQYRPVGVATE